MTGWLIFLGIITVIAVLPVGASVCYDALGFRACVIAGPVKIKLFPRAKKEKKPDQTGKTDASGQTPEEVAQEDLLPEGKPEGAPSKDLGKPSDGGSLLDFLPLLDVAMDMLSSLVGRLRVNCLQLHLTLAGDDPCDLAVNYGRAQAAGGALLAKLNEWLVIKKQDVGIACDFTADETKIVARVDLTITVGRAVGWAVRYGVRALTTFLKIKKQREKGGAAL